MSNAAAANNIVTDEALKEKILYMKSILNEKQYRQFLANEAIAFGHGGRTKISRLSGSSLSTIRKGINEVGSFRDGNTKPDTSCRVRKEGGGRKASTETYPNLKDAIQGIVDDKTYGDPERILAWTTYSLMEIASPLAERYGILVSHTVVSSVLEGIGYSKQANRKMFQAGKRTRTGMRSSAISMKPRKSIWEKASPSYPSTARKKKT